MRKRFLCILLEFGLDWQLEKDRSPIVGGAVGFFFFLKSLFALSILKYSMLAAD